MSRIKSAFLGSITSQLFMLLSMLLTMMVTPMVLKFLNKEEYGFYTILFQIVGYLSMLDFGLSGAVTRSLAANRGEDAEGQLAVNKIISTSFFIYALLGLLVVIVGMLFTPYVPEVFHMAESMKELAPAMMLTLSIFVGIQFPTKVFSSIFYAHQRQALSNVVGFLVGICNILLPLFFLYLGYGLWSFIYTNILCTAIQIGITLFLVRKHYSFLKLRIRFFDFSLCRQLFHFGFFIFLSAIAYQIVFFTDRFFIGSFVSLTATTVFTLTVKAPDLCRELIFRITDNALPAMVEISVKDRVEKLRTIHFKLALLTVCLTSVAIWTLFIINKWFVALWVGSEYFAGDLIMLLALILVLQHTFLHVSTICLFGKGEVKGVSLMGLVEAAANLILTFWLGKLYGITGIISATILASALTMYWYVPMVTMKHFNISFADYFIKPLIYPLIATSVPGLILLFFSKKFFETFDVTWINFLILSAIVAASLGSFVWFVFIRKAVAEYVPHRFRRYLLIGG